MSARRAWLAAGIAVTGVAAAAVLARQRARHNREMAQQAAMLVECCERLDDYDKALAVIGYGMLGPRRPRMYVVSGAG